MYGGKKGVLISEPDVTEYEIDKQNWDFMFMGCDGIYDIF